MNLTRKLFIEYHTSILEREINELKSFIEYHTRGSKWTVYWISHKYIRDMEINELNEEVVYWISHKYIREGNKWTKRGSRLLNITQVY